MLRPINPVQLIQKTYDQLTKKQQKYVDCCVRYGDRNVAWEKAGFSTKGRGWKANARNLFLRLSKIIEEQIEQKIGSGAVLALSIVQEIMEDKDQPGATRLKAAQDYLNRAGYDKPVEQTIHVNNVSEKDIENEIQALLSKAKQG